MNRPANIISPLVFILTLLFSAVTSGQDGSATSCRKCHEAVYMKTASYKFQHSIVKDKCPVCHITPEKEDEIFSLLNFPTLQKEGLIHLDRLSVDQDYQAEVVITDSKGKKCAPELLNITPKNSWEPDGQRVSFKLKKLSGVTVDEIKRRGFAMASVSWDTDVFSTSEIEYRLAGERPGTFKIKDIYTKAHQITLEGLKHKSRYYFRAVSKDIYGTILKSEEYTFDTAEEVSRPVELRDDDPGLPAVNHMQVFRSPGNDGLFLKVSANKRCEISVKIREVKQKDGKHGFGLLPARYSRIDVCYKCHPHDSSHPVGVKASSPKIRTPDGLPTIEDGIITCVTCHTPHGGDRVYFNRFDFRKDLCMRCHLEKYDNL